MASSAESGRRRHWDEVDSDPEEEGDDASALHTAPAGSHDVVPAFAADWPGLFSISDAVADAGARFPQSLVDVFFSATTTAHASISGARAVPDALAPSVAARARPVAGTELRRTAFHRTVPGKANRIIAPLWVAPILLRRCTPAAVGGRRIVCCSHVAKFVSGDSAKLSQGRAVRS